MAKTPQVYDASAIQALKGLEPVRRMPGMYTHTIHPLHIVQEAIDNAVDEALAGFGRRITVTVRKDHSVEVEDEGRGATSSAVDAPQNPRDGRPLAAQIPIAHDRLLERDEVVVDGGHPPETADQGHEANVEMPWIEDDEEGGLRRAQQAPREPRVHSDRAPGERQLGAGEQCVALVSPEIEADHVDLEAEVVQEA